jgi:hypothetical protein
MRQVLVAAAMLSGLALFTGKSQAAGPIDVTFTNKTDVKVTFFLNGGKGLETRLNAGESSSYTMGVDNGVQPIIRIYQADGKSLDFKVENGGRYVFMFKDGKIQNCFE